MWVPAVVWFSIVILRCHLLCLNPAGLSNSILASRKWAKERWVVAVAQCASVSLTLKCLNTMFVDVVASPSRVALRVTAVLSTLGMSDWIHNVCSAFSSVEYLWKFLLIGHLLFSVSGKRKAGARLASPMSCRLKRIS